jgi:hypothetical protein
MQFEFQSCVKTIISESVGHRAIDAILHFWVFCPLIFADKKNMHHDSARTKIEPILNYPTKMGCSMGLY